MNPSDDRHRKRLKDDVLRARRQLEKYRKARRVLVEDYAGDLWVGDRGERAQPRIINNLLLQAVRAMVLALAARRPMAKIATDYRELFAFARLYEVTLNNYLKVLRPESSLRDCVEEACFFMGIARVGLLPAGQTEYGDPGRPGLESISPDDWFHDTSARCDERMRFCGHYYEADVEDLRADPRVDQKNLAKLTPGRRGNRDYEGAEPAPVKDLETEGEREWDGYDGSVCLADVWLPRERVLATFDADFTVLLSEQKWEGPRRGPYHLLRFDRVRDSVMGLPFAYNLKPLFSLFNNLWRKMDRQARSSKTVGLYGPDNEADAQNIRRLSDGQFGKANSPDAIKTLTFNGVDPAVATFSVAVADAFNSASGNIETLAGLGPAADTVGQERIIDGRLGQQIGKMTEEVAGFVGGILEDLGWWLWQDEVLTLPGELPVYDRGLGVAETVPIEWLPGDRDGDYAQYNFSLVPYSMAYKSPAEQAAIVERLLVGVAAPLMPYMQEQGIGVDFNAAFETLARLNDVPELREFLVPTEPPSNGKPGPMSDGPRKPPVTNRTYTRKNVSTGGTQKGRSVAMAAAYGGSATPQQRATVQGPK